MQILLLIKISEEKHITHFLFLSKRKGKDPIFVKHIFLIMNFDFAL